jgi:sarcosine oxidase subunit gamma
MTFKPIMQSPLQHFNLAEKAVKMDASQGVWANELPLLAYINLRGNSQNTAFTVAVASVLGESLPTLPCKLIHATWGYIYWLSPDEWLLVCSRENNIDLQRTLKTALMGIHSQVIDNSGGYTTVCLQGKHANDVLQHCTVYNLHALAPNNVVGTTFGKTSVWLHRQDNGYQLIIRRSFADYIWRYLERATTPYGFGIALLD